MTDLERIELAARRTAERLRADNRFDLEEAFMVFSENILRAIQVKNTLETE